MNWQERSEKAEAELARLREQKPVAWFMIDKKGVMVVTTNPYTASYRWARHSVYELFSAHVPEQREGELAVAAPIVLERLMYALKDLKARAYKQLDHGKGRSISIDSNIAIDIADALLQSSPQSDKGV